MIGSTYAGFTVLERLSRGGMADIYLAMDAVGNRYTLRTLLPELRQDSTRVHQFINGCRILADLNHPNVSRLFQSGKKEGLLYAVLEYVDGNNLKELILKKDAGLPLHQLPLLLGVAAALAHVHDRGFLHLDVKPENILVDRNYNPKLIDFDLAMPRPEKPKKLGVSSGTPAYWAPEQLAREATDERADIFSFGVLAYEMLSGKKPINGESREEIFAKYSQFDQHLVPLRERAPAVPAGLERVVLKCLEKDLDRRYPSMSLVVRDLQK